MEETKERSVCFETQADDEEIILLLRAHVITNLPWLVLVIALFAIPSILSRTDLFDPIFAPLQITSKGSALLTLCWYLLVFAIALQNILLWYFNVYILTSKRIVDIDFNQLLYRQISSTDLASVQDITYTKGGIAQSLFNYGDLRIQTAGSVPQFEFLKVGDPGAVQKQIERVAEASKNGL